MSIPIPEDVSHVYGCTCSGGDLYHEVTCGLFALSVEDFYEAVDAARNRSHEWAAAAWQRIDGGHR